MKYISDELVTRLRQAASNGSTVAEKICKVIKSITPSTIPQGSYFRLINGNIVDGEPSVSVAYCDFRPGDMVKTVIKNYPDAAWGSRYLTHATLAEFAKILEPVIGPVTPYDCAMFTVMMAIPSKLVVRSLDSFNDQVQSLMQGYVSSLDFREGERLIMLRKDAELAVNTLRAMGLKRIVVVEDLYGAYLGRSFVWNAVASGTPVTVMDFQCGARSAQKLLKSYAEKTGINVVYSPDGNEVLNPVGDVRELSDIADLIVPIKVPDNPYSDWLYTPFRWRVFVKTADGLALSFKLPTDSSPVELVWDPNNNRYSKNHICPFCGKVFNGSGDWCPTCQESRDDIVGGVIVGKAVNLYGAIVPEVFTRKYKSGYKLTENARMSYFIRALDVN